MTTPSMDETEIEVPGRPDIPGLRFRHFRGPSDYRGMAEANQAARDAAGSLDVVNEASMALQYATLVNSDTHDDLLIVELDTTIIGYARVEWREAIEGPRYLNAICLLHPAHRRRGIGGAMLAWEERRMLAIAASLPGDTQAAMRAWTWDTDAGASALFERRGWTPQGRGYEMVRPTLDDIPDVPLPDHFEIRLVGPADDRRVWDASAEAFRDERGEGAWDEGDWQRHIGDPYRDPTLWAVAFFGDEVAGGVHGRIDPDENAHLGVQQGLIAGVWTRRPYRRRGLARALLARVLVLLRERGMTSAHLGVDGLNPNQALDLYESLGFRIHTSETDWAKPVPRDATPIEEAP